MEIKSTINEIGHKRYRAYVLYKEKDRYSNYGRA